MADDLDAFFDEVSDAEQEAVADSESVQAEVTVDAAVEEPPTKKAKTDTDTEIHTTAVTIAPPVRPRRVVVASSTVIAASAGATTSKTPSTASSLHSAIGPSGPPPPPPPPMGHQSYGPPPPPPPPPPPHHQQYQQQQQHQQQQQQQYHQQQHHQQSMNNLPPLPQQPPLPPGPAPPPTKKAPVRTAAGKTWVDESLADWPDNDFRLFVGNLPPEVTDEQLYQHFAKYPSLQRSRVVGNQKGISKGYGFVSFIAPLECAKALREMDQTWLGSRPIRVKRSSWKDRDWKEVRKNESKNNKQRKRMGLL